MTINPITGSNEESYNQREARLRKDNPFLDDESIKQLIRDETSRSINVLTARDLFQRS